MQSTAVVIGAQDEVGHRICHDLDVRGYRVLKGRIGDFNSSVGDGWFEIDPMSTQSVNSSAAKLNQPLDALVVNLDYRSEGSSEGIRDGQDYQALLAAYDYNAVGPIRMIKAFLPLLERSEDKRICVVTTAESSNNNCYDTANYMNHTSKAALNMGLHILFNDLRPKGYHFRLYCKAPGEAAESVTDFAVEYFLRNRSMDEHSAKHSDENRLVLRNWEGREIPW